MKLKLTGILLLAALSSACSTLYYGYLPGSDLEIYQNEKPIDLKGNSYDLDLKDSRNINTPVKCTKVKLDRNTHLEGHTGMSLVREYFVKTIPEKNGKISTDGIPLEIEVQHVSFKLIGAVFIRTHGITQLKATSGNFSKTYCVDLTESDPDAPLHWYSFDTRKGASNKFASVSVRRAVSQILEDLSKLKNSNATANR